MKKIKLAHLLGCLLFVATLAASARPVEPSSVIDKVVAAYGGDKLTNAKSIKLIDYNKGPWPGESENPGLPEIWRINEELTIDFKSMRKSLLSYRVPRTTLDLEKWIFDGEQGVKYDILHKKVSVEDWVTYDNLGGSIVRSSDTMHARRLHSEKRTAAYLGEAYYRGKVHQKLKVTFSSGGEFTYFIEHKSGLIKKVVRHHPRASLVYVFSNHQLSDGLTYASDLNFFVNGELRITSVQRGIELNPDLKQAFKRLNHYKGWGKTFENDERSAQQLANGIYQIGKSRTKTVFIEQNDHFIAIGGASALKTNYEEVKQLADSDKPIQYFVVTHHHRNNLRGLDIPVELGANLVVAREHLETVTRSLTAPIEMENVVVIEDRAPRNLGNITLFDIPTAHSQHYLLAYSPESKLVIAEEHFETDLVSAQPRIYKGMVTFGNALKSLNIEVEHLVDIRSWRKISQREFYQWTKDFEEKSCPPGYAICSNG